MHDVGQTTIPRTPHGEALAVDPAGKGPYAQQNRIESCGADSAIQHQAGAK
jgi:hypothetical protein